MKLCVLYNTYIGSDSCSNIFISYYIVAVYLLETTWELMLLESVTESFHKHQLYILEKNRFQRSRNGSYVSELFWFDFIKEQI